MKGEASTVQARGQALIERPRPGSLQGAPTRVRAAWMGLGAITVVVLLCALARSEAALAALEVDDASPAASVTARAIASTTATAAPPEPPKVATAPPAELAAAGRDTSALSALADRYPADAEVLKALFLAHAADRKGYTAALRAALKLLEVAPARADDADVQKALVAIASGPPDTAGAALELMAAKLGRRGPDLIYEVAAGFSPAKLRAAALLKDPEVKKLASPALLFANELRETLPCARKAMAGRAAAEGDARAIVQLKPLLNTGCGFLTRGECYRCVTPADRKAIQDAIDAIESRWGGRDPPKPPG
jgi:hypothetical protein